MSDERSLTIKSFCEKYRISAPVYYKWQRNGTGPKELRIGRVIRITPEAEREWLEARAVPDEDLVADLKARGRHAAACRS